jgi:VanZ family protein
VAARPRRRSSSATPLAAVYGALVLYASLFPFAGWRWPPGQDLPALLALPWPPWRDPFDAWANLLGYLPLGMLVAFAARRSGLTMAASALLGLALPALLSFGCEVLQQFVPTRHPSLKDWTYNAAGAAIGVLLALALHVLGWIDRWHALRERWFAGDSAGALALLALWPLALLAPAPVPLGLGQVADLLREVLAGWLEGVDWAAPVLSMVTSAPIASQPLGPLAEGSITALGLLAPCLLAYGVVEPGWRRLALAFGALTLAVASMTLSTLLNFGPQHAWAWIGRSTTEALVVATAISCLLAAVPRRMAAGCGLIVLGALAASVAQAPADPYFALSLQAWEQGRFVRFHGLAQWIGWLWPYVAIAWLLLRLGAPR